MSKNSRSIEAEVQQVLDEPWNKKEIRFAPSVGKITKTVPSTPSIFTMPGCAQSVSHRAIIIRFRDLVRTAVLERVAKMSGPLKDWHKAKTD